MQWLRALETPEALRALCALPGVTLPVAATLLLYELRRPVLPVCTNTLLEARGLGWVPPHAGGVAAFLHLQARLATAVPDATAMRELYCCLCQHSAFRLTRQAVVGDGDKRIEAMMLRDRRAAVPLQLALSSGPGGGVGTRRAACVGVEVVELEAAETVEAAEDDEDDDVGDEEQKEKDDDDDDDDDNRTIRALMAAAPGVRALRVAAGVDTPSGQMPSQPLAHEVVECMHHHQLYPESGCTPLLMVLCPTDYEAATVVARAYETHTLPLQQLPNEGDGLRYVVDVVWSEAELLALALVVASAEMGEDDSPSEAYVGALRDVLGRLARGEAAAAGAGAPLFGFGAQLESGMHIAARMNATRALVVLSEAAAAAVAAHSPADPTATMPPAVTAAPAPVARHSEPFAGAGEVLRDGRGRTVLHAACAAGRVGAASWLLERGDDARALDADGRSPLALAAAAGALDVIALLVDAAPDMVQAERSPPLELAAAAGSVDAVELLLARGAPLDYISKAGKTACHAACRAGHVHVARCLVDHGCDLALRDRSDRPAHELLPDAVRTDAQWLVDTGKAAVAAARRKPASTRAIESRLRDPISALMSDGF